MTKTMQRIRLGASALAIVMTLLFPLSARALAAAGTDAVEIGEDGVVTLVSDRLAGEMVSSVQVRIGVDAAEGDSVGFVFDGGLAGWLTNSSYRDGTLNIYVAGTTPLMAAGETRLTLGTITGGDPASVTLPEDALQYVYGTRVIAQSAEANVYWSAPDTGEDSGPEGDSGDVPGPAPLPESGARSGLQELLAQAKGIGPEGYTLTSYEQLLSAIADAEAVLADSNAADADLNAAAAALQKALDQMVPVAEADGSGPVIGDGADDGTGSGAPESTAAPPSDEEQDAPDVPPVTDMPTATPGLTASAEPTATPEPTTGPEPTDSSEPTTAPEPTADPASVDDSRPSISPEFTATADEQATPTAAAAGQPSAPDTGDDTPVLLWTLVLCLSGGALAAVPLRRGKNRR